MPPVSWTGVVMACAFFLISVDMVGPQILGFIRHSVCSP